MDDGMIYCYICSAARSGSTFLDMLIGGHPNAASLGEFSFLGKAIALAQTCACGEKVPSCGAWTKVFDIVLEEKGVDLRNEPYALEQWDARASVVIDRWRQTRFYEFMAKYRSWLCDVHFGRYGISVPWLPERLRDGIQNTIYLYNVVGRAWDKKLIVDSSKNIHKALALYSAAPERTKILWLVRDGRGVFFSRRRSGFSRHQAALGWKRYNQRAMDLLPSNLPETSLMRVHYEHLASEPEQIVRKICDFLEVEFMPEMLDLAAGERHMVNGNATMYRRDSGIVLDERWKREMSSEDLVYFARRCGRLNEALGYS